MEIKFPLDPQKIMKEFFTAFQPPRTPEFWAGLVREELSEYYYALQNEEPEDIWKELGDLVYTMAGYMAVGGDDADLISHVSKTISMGVDAATLDILGRTTEPKFSWIFLDILVAHIHRSNMSKLDSDGKPFRRKDGKILKGPNYEPPNMQEFARNIEEAYEMFTGEQNG